MKNKPTNFPCSPVAEAMIIGNWGWEAYGMYVRMLQLIYKMPDKCLPKIHVDHMVNSNGMDAFIVSQLLENPALFISDETRFFAVTKVINKKEDIVDNIIPTHELQKYIKNFFPRVSSLPIQMSVKNCESILSDYDKHLVAEKLKAMENCSYLLKKYVNVYLTLNNWCRMEMDRGWTKPDQKIAPPPRQPSTML